MEIIREIREIRETIDNFFIMAGYEIKTSKQSIKLLIGDEQSCCESWGYFLSEDDTQYFIGANLRNVTVTDTALKTYDVDNLKYLDNGDVMFVNIKTSRGLLQFVAYNVHNGYYGHKAIVKCSQLNYSRVL